MNRRLLLLWDDDPGPTTLPQPRYFLGLDGYGGRSWLVVGCATGTSDLHVVEQREFLYPTHRELLHELMSLVKRYQIEMGYLDLIEPYRVLLKSLPQLQICPRLTKSVRNDIRLKVRRHLSDVSLNTALLAACLVSENDDRMNDRSYKDAFGLMVWSYEIALAKDRQREDPYVVLEKPLS